MAALFQELSLRPLRSGSGGRSYTTWSDTTGALEFTQKGRVVDPSRAKGPIRLRLPP
ncbi:MAG: DUF3253 domain-containing protein [Deltaproteobacteria bacterium]|nr:DUF3253 domain-containing protein [Deltaproteobacteria bacterium]